MIKDSGEKQDICFSYALQPLCVKHQQNIPTFTSQQSFFMALWLSTTFEITSLIRKTASLEK